jgi:hypothetical protein
MKPNSKFLASQCELWLRLVADLAPPYLGELDSEMEFEALDGKSIV